MLVVLSCTDVLYLYLHVERSEENVRHRHLSLPADYCDSSLPHEVNLWGKQ